MKNKFKLFWQNTPLHIQITLKMLLILLCGLSASSVITYSAFIIFFGEFLRPRLFFNANKLVSQFDDLNSDSLQPPTPQLDINDNSREELISPDGSERILIRRHPDDNNILHFIQQTQIDFSTILIIYFVISTIVIVMLSIICVYYSTKKSINQVQTEHEKMLNFIQNVSHDLRTPLSSIQGWSKLIKLKGEFTKEAAKIENNAKKMNILIDDMLILANIDKTSNEHPLENDENNVNTKNKTKIHEFELCKFIRNIVEDFSLEHNNRSITYTLPNYNIIFKSTSDRAKMNISRILDNLINNALKYTEENNKIHIDLTISNNSKFIKIKVSDDGIGVPNDKINTIFERFTKLDESRNTSGNGLGLAIVKELVISMNGTVEAEFTDKNNQSGLTVIITLPVV